MRLSNVWIVEVWAAEVPCVTVSKAVNLTCYDLRKKISEKVLDLILFSFLKNHHYIKSFDFWKIPYVLVINQSWPFFRKGGNIEEFKSVRFSRSVLIVRLCFKGARKCWFWYLVELIFPNLYTTSFIKLIRRLMSMLIQLEHFSGILNWSLEMMVQTLLQMNMMLLLVKCLFSSTTHSIFIIWSLMETLFYVIWLRWSFFWGFSLLSRYDVPNSATHGYDVHLESALHPEYALTFHCSAAQLAIIIKLTQVKVVFPDSAPFSKIVAQTLPQMNRMPISVNWANALSLTTRAFLFHLRLHREPIECNFFFFNWKTERFFEEYVPISSIYGSNSATYAYEFDFRQF